MKIKFKIVEFQNGYGTVFYTIKHKYKWFPFWLYEKKISGGQSNVEFNHKSSAEKYIQQYYSDQKQNTRIQVK